MKLPAWLTPNRQITLVLIFCLLLTLSGVAWGLAMYSALDNFRSPLKDSPPQPGAALGSALTRRVVFVLIDALRLDTSQQADVMPALNRLRQQGASAVMHSGLPSYSEPGYTTLLTGAWPALNDAGLLNKNYANLWTWTQDDLFSAAHRSGLKTAVSGYYWFEKMIPQAAVNAHFYIPDGDEQADQQVMAAALPWLDQDFGLILIHIDQVDNAGHHEGGPRSPAWTAAARRADDLLAAIAARLDLSRDTLLVVSDHGQIDQGGHGGPEAVVVTEPFVLAGAGIKPGSYGDIQMTDVAPTLAVLLGTNLPASAQGQPRQEMLNLPAAAQVGLAQAVKAQQAQLVESYTKAIGQPAAAEKIAQASDVPAFQQLITAAVNDRLYLERVPRWVSMGFVLLLAAGLVTRIPRRALAWSYAGALVSLLVFHVVFLIVNGAVYSLSMIATISGMVIFIGGTATLASLAGVLASLAGQGGLRAAPRAAAWAVLGQLLALLSLLALPAAANYAFNGLLSGWITPEPLPWFLALLSLLQALVAALLAFPLAALAARFARPAAQM